MTDAERATLDQCLAASDARCRRLAAASPLLTDAHLDEFGRWITLMRARHQPEDTSPIRCAVCRWPYGVVHVHGRVEYIDILLVKDLGTVDHDAPEHPCPVIPPPPDPDARAHTTRDSAPPRR